MDTNETKIYIAFLIAIGIVAVIILYFLIIILRQQKRNLNLYKEKVRAEVTTLENERKRLVVDLHDELGPLLSIAKLQVSAIHIESKEDEKLAEMASDHIQSVLVKMHEISNNLMPQALSRKGLASALQEFTTALNHTNALQLVLATPTQFQLTTEQELHIYRIVQEITHNALKHSQAKKLEIIFENSKSKLTMIARDNGKGFDYKSRLYNGQGLGLKSLLSRVELLGGELFIDSQIDKGTSYTIEIPSRYEL